MHHGNDHKKLEPITEDAARPLRNTRKNTKKWCKGKVGRPHTTQWKMKYLTFGPEAKPMWSRLTCTVCGKELDWCFRWSTDKPCVCGLHDRKAEANEIDAITR